jgi:hypothetical protein
MLMQSYMADMLFLEFGVEEDEFNHLVAHYNLYNNQSMDEIIFGD